MSQSIASESGHSNPVAKIIRPVVDPQTYKNLLYLILGVPLGMVYFVLVTVGLATGLGLSVLLIGLGILLATVIGLRSIASLERRLANTLLGTEIPAPDDVEQDGDGIVATATAYLRAPSTWRGLGFVLLKFWLGVLSLLLLIAFLGTALELLLLPVFPAGVLNVEVFGWIVADSFSTSMQRTLVSPVGALLAVVALHVLNAYARVNASIAASLLGPKQSPADDSMKTDDAG